MILLGALVPVAAFVVMRARTDLLLQHNVRRAMETFYTAESGLEHAIADLSLDSRFERLIVDSTFPFRIEPPASFPRPPYRYTVTVKRRRGDAVDLVARGVGSRGASRAIAAVVLRSANLYVPAALFTAANQPHVLVDNRFALSGLPALGDKTEVPPVAVPTEDQALHLAGELASGVTVKDYPILQRLLADAAGSEGVNRIAGSVQGSIGSGIHISSGALELTDVSGSGVLIVDGALTVHGDFEFSGIVLVLGDLQFDRDSNADVRGSVLQGPSARLLHLLGAGRIAYDEKAIQRLDRLLPGFLPHRAVVVGRREIS